MSNPSLVLAVDPGKATGWLRWHLDDDFLEYGEDEQMAFCARQEAWLWWAHQSGLLVHVVCESFIITQATAKNTQAPWSLEIIGTIRYLAHKTGATFSLQSAAEAKSFSTNDKLKRVGWYIPGKGHATDAARHLLLWAVENRRISPRLVID